MKRKLNKWLSGVLAACVLFTTVPVYAINDISGTETSTEVVETSEETQSSEIETSNIEETNQESSESTESSEITSEQTSEIADEMLNISPTDLGDEEEPSTDNWELGLVFYDSTVDNGKTPLTSIDWDASDGSYFNGDTRTITVQINYKNTNAITTYQPGDLKISIPNIMYNQDEIGRNSTSYLEWNVLVGANDSSHSGYDWNFKGINEYREYDNLTKNVKEIVFTNANTINEKANFEGSIQIVYTLTPHTEYERVFTGGSSYRTYQPEKYEDTCIHNLNLDLQASLNDITKSEKVSFNYTRTYTHPWEKLKYEITKTASKISSYDGLGENASDFTWIKYTFKTSNAIVEYPYYKVESNYQIKDSLPQGTIVYNTAGKQIPLDKDNTCLIELTDYSNAQTVSIYVGYPKSIYNEKNNNMNITNTVELLGTYVTETEQSFLATDSISINLAEFEFTYSGELYKVEKWFDDFHEEELRYQDIINGIKNNGYNYKTYNHAMFYTYYKAIYTGTPMTLRLGDDLLYATNKEGNYSKLNDNEYYFSSISGLSSLKNGNGNIIEKGKYDCELFVRYAGSTEYVSYEKFKNGYGGWNFTKEDQVVGWYINIYNLKESIMYDEANWSNRMVNTRVILLKTDIPQSGRLYNFNYLQVYFENEDGTPILQNEPDLDSYSSYITQEIAEYDITTYGTYMQRGFAYSDWKYFKIKQPEVGLRAFKSFNKKYTQDALNEKFSGECEIGVIRSSTTKCTLSEYVNNYFEQLDPEYTLKGFRIYDLLPLGMELSSTEEEILNSITPNAIDYIYDLSGKKLTEDEVLKIIKDNTQITISENWNNTGRTKLEIISNFSNTPFYCEAYSYSNTNNQICSFTYKYEISYDNFLDFGNAYTNYVYIDRLENNKTVTLSGVKDNGQYDKDAIDINENNNTEEILAYNSSEITITSVVSTHQDVQTQVSSTLSNYSTGIVNAEYGKNYSYKLRVRSGENDITNLVIYDNLEKWTKDKNGNFIEAAGKKKYWQGEFLGVDTSYAESKGYTVKVYYSENEKAGTLTEDTSWKEYSDTVDKTKVKSLAFQYLDSEGNPAVLPANSLTYVEINMKAPADEKITTLAYNGCWTQWNALDDFGQPVDFITGINSNIVKVALPNSIIDDELPTVTLKFIKEISGTDSDFENMLLDKADERNFKITLTSLTANEDGSYNQITGLLSSIQGLTLSKVPIGTYLITESDDIYFDFVEMVPNNDEEIIIEGVTLEKTAQGYVLTISDDLSGDVEFNIKVTNKIEPDRPYEDKEEIENLFKIPSVDA